MARSTIICVDDDKWMLDVLSQLLKDWLGNNYTVEKATSGQEALDIISDCMSENEDVSLVVSDYIMPGMKGDEVLELVKRKTPMTRRIMLTGFAAIEGITNAINKAGIYRFMSKPWDNKDMMLTVLQAIRSFEQDKRTDQLSKSNEEMFHKFKSLSVNLQSSLKQVVEALAAAAELRNGGSEGHAGRVAAYCTRLAQRLDLSEDDARQLETSALMHDAGMLGLSDDEVKLMRGTNIYAHTSVVLKQSEYAKAILKDMDERLLSGVLYHMERADGRGPHGMSAASIPLFAKIIGLCNYLDVMASARPGDAPSAVLHDMEIFKGKIFDPALFDMLVEELLT